MSFLENIIRFFMKLFGAKTTAPLDLPPSTGAASEEEEEENDARAAPFDTAGFDPGRDEDAFFEAHLVMESEGMIAPGVSITEANRAETMARFGIRDRAHWYAVRDACDRILVEKHGSLEAVSQRMLNFRANLSQRHLQAEGKRMDAQGAFAPVLGISLDQWAAMNAAIAAGANVGDLLKGSGIDRARWDKAAAEWMLRMERDATFVITQRYGEAFQNASKGKYAAHAREAAAARAANRELTLAPPVDLETYLSLAYEQACYAKIGKSPTDLLQSQGMSIVDWCDLSTFMGYHLARTWSANHVAYTAVIKRMEARYLTAYPGVDPDMDISF